MGMNWLTRLASSVGKGRLRIVWKDLRAGLGDFKRCVQA